MWTEHLRDTKPVKGVFGENIPALQGLLHEVILHQDGTSLKLRMDLKDYPKEAPKKWVEKNFNTAQITLLVGTVSDLTISGWTRDNAIEIEIAKNGDAFELTAQSATIKIHCKAALISVLELTGYRKR